MKIIFFFLFSSIILYSYSQQNFHYFKNDEVIRLDSIGRNLHKLKEYKNAIEYFDKALEIDSTYGNAIYHRALSIANYDSKSCSPINLCDEFKKAMNYGVIIEEPVLFFYGCENLILKK